MHTATIIYLHGFNSAPASHKAQRLQGYMAERGLAQAFRCPRLPPVPNEAIATIEEEVRRAAGKAITFVGSSLGGFYATYFAERHPSKAVLLNPAVRPQQDLESYVGPQRNLYTGESYELKHEHIEQWRALDTPVAHPERYLLIVETADEVLDYRLAVDKYAGAQQIVIEGGDHSLQSFPEHLDTILRFAGLAPV